MTSRIRSIIKFAGRRLAAVHSDERGTVSIMTVFALFMFTILLVKIVNVGRHVDDKIRMQNAADASAYSSGVVIARGMNTLAFTNHLEAEIFALDAYMRTALMRDREGRLVVQSLTPQILAKWNEVGKVFEQHGGSASYAKFQTLGRSIQDKVPLERDVVAAFSEMSARHAQLTLPVLEYILHAGAVNQSGTRDPLQTLGQPVNVPEGGIIPRFQRAVVRSIPRIANLAGDEIGRRYGKPGRRLRDANGNPQPLQCRLWRTDATAVQVADESDPLARSVPAIDPSPTGSDGPPDPRYTAVARNQRQALARRYLELWIRDWMGPYFSYAAGLTVSGIRQNRPGRDTAKMSQFINLWRSFACGHLRILLDMEYRTINLPHVIRLPNPGLTQRESMERDYQFVSVAYWSHIDEEFPGLFRNLLKRGAPSDALTFAQTTVFLPRRRHRCCPWAWPITIRQPDGTVVVRWRNNVENWPQNWDLLNQNWTCKLSPATAKRMPAILQQVPPGLPTFHPPQFTNMSPQDFRRLNNH